MPSHCESPRTCQEDENFPRLFDRPPGARTRSRLRTGASPAVWSTDTFIVFAPRRREPRVAGRLDHLLRRIPSRRSADLARNCRTHGSNREGVRGDGPPADGELQAARARLGEEVVNGVGGAACGQSLAVSTVRRGVRCGGGWPSGRSSSRLTATDTPGFTRSYGPMSTTFLSRLT